MKNNIIAIDLVIFNIIHVGIYVHMYICTYIRLYVKASLTTML